MNRPIDTIETEDRYYAPFFNRTMKISIERGQGVYVWDEAGDRYLDFTSGWGVTSLGHAHPVITRALAEQGGKIIQGPNAGLTYSPVRARLLSAMREILPGGLIRIFFANSGAEANDAVIKLARKVKKKLNIVSSLMSFHGRTISTVSATGQEIHRNKYNPLMPNYLFVPFNDIDALKKVMSEDVAAVILEPIQGEGGVRVPADGYLSRVSGICVKHDALLIVDEIQTGFCRTGPFFASDNRDVKIDFMTMGKGIAGGFPFAAFAMTDDVASRLETGDHGGTYCGNPLGCAVSLAVVRYMQEHRISDHVKQIGAWTIGRLQALRQRHPRHIVDVRGRGLLLALEFARPEIVEKINRFSFEHRLLLNIKHGTIIRIFPALTITQKEMAEGLDLLSGAIDETVRADAAS
jgi:acetylornithine/N-succinyldiaminopimelate aminotransferase